MERTRTVRFVGGPLHGDSRTVETAKTEYRINFGVATALATAMGEAAALAPPGPETLTYARRKDGRYYLRVDPPAGFENVPEGFTFEWFDVSGGILLLEITGPRSDVGSAIVELRLAREFLADAAIFEQGAAVLLERARADFDNQERAAIRGLSPDVVRTLADALEADTPASREQGNRRVAALILREWACSREHFG